MNRGNCDTPDREIGEEENELLSRLWEKISEGEMDREADEAGYEELQQRIHSKIRYRQLFRIAMAGSVAAIAILFFLVFGMPSMQTESVVYTQLQEMGVEVVRDEVVLTMDDGTTVRLDSVAKIESQSVDLVAVQVASGKKLTLEKQRMLKVEVPEGRKFQLTLADGTQVWLNAASSLEYPATFEKGTERRVKLEGEAFFEVKPDPDSPFYVELSGQESIRVLGTSFNVNAYPEASVHTTTLLTGKISYCPGKGQKTLMLVPDQQVRLDCVKGITKLCRVDAAAYAAWKEGWIWFEEEKLPLLALRLSRAYGIQIEVDERYRDYSFSGKIRFERGIEYITKLLTETTDIRCVVEDGRIILK